MQRYFLEFIYVGTAYHGWQIQRNAVSVQSVLTGAINKLTGENVELTGAGRTDTGVHALQMYCHFDLKKPTSSYKDFVYQLNALLPNDISACSVTETSDKAHARFDATSRTYIYQMHFRKDPFNVDRSWYYPFDLDLEKMNAACEILMKFKDFSCFSKSRTQTKTNICKISKAEWKMKGGNLMFEIRADRFLRNMVRAIVGTMIQLGRDQMSIADFKKVLNSKDRKRAGISVPASGLYLKKITYPTHIFNSK